MSKVLAVFGATGQQGGNVATYALIHPQLSSIYTDRGITRDVSKPAAVALQKRDVEMVKRGASWVIENVRLGFLTEFRR